MYSQEEGTLAILVLFYLLYNTVSDTDPLRSSRPANPLIIIMNKLNPGAFEFVPGKVYRVPVPSTETQKPFERPEQVEAPAPPPTISLNIGAPKPPAVPAGSAANTASAAKLQQVVSKPTPKPTVTAPKPDSSSKTYSTEKANVVPEVEEIADKAVLEDLFGHGVGLLCVSCHHTI